MHIYVYVQYIGVVHWYGVCGAMNLTAMHANTSWCMYTLFCSISFCCLVLSKKVAVIHKEMLRQEIVWKILYINVHLDAFLCPVNTNSSESIERMPIGIHQASCTNKVFQIMSWTFLVFYVSAFFVYALYDRIVTSSVTLTWWHYLFLLTHITVLWVN